VKSTPIMTVNKQSQLPPPYGVSNTAGAN